MKTRSTISKYREKLKNNIFFQNIAVVTGGETRIEDAWQIERGYESLKEKLDKLIELND